MSYNYQTQTFQWIYNNGKHSRFELILEVPKRSPALYGQAKIESWNVETGEGGVSVQKEWSWKEKTRQREARMN
jgi:hypothetical protein